MEKNEIKKLLYKKNPIAKLEGIRKGIAHYSSYGVKTDSNDLITIEFEIPLTDMLQGDFELEMDSKYLIRWIVDEYTPL